MITNKEKRIENEISHGERIKEHAEDIWGWSTPAGQKRADRRARYLIELGNLSPQKKVLEIGCGTSLFTEKIYNWSKANITAIDISEALLEKARKKLTGVTFMQENAMNMSFEDNSFDTVLGSSILHHLDVELAMKEIFRVLKKDGSIVFAEPNMINPQIFIQKNVPFIKRWMGDTPDEIAFVRWKLKKTLKKIGFNKIDIFPYDFLHPATPKPMINFVSKVGGIVEKTPVIREIAGSLIITAKK